MILYEGLALYGFIFIITIPIYAIYSLIKYINRRIENRNVYRLMREVDTQMAEIDRENRIREQEFAEINRLREAIDNSTDKAETKLLRNQLYALLDSN